MKSSERIPQRENSINRLVNISLMHLQVHTKIASVDVCKQIRAYSRMIQGRIEYFFIFSISSLYINFRQVLIPFIMSIGPYLFKIPFRNFSLNVLSCSINVHCRNSNLHKDLLVFCRFKFQQSFIQRQFLTIIYGHCISIDFVCEWFGKFSIESYLLVESPIFGSLIAANFGIAQYINIHIHISLSLDRIIHINNKSGIIALRESISMDSGPLCRRQLSLYGISVKENRIISRNSHLIFV